MSPHRNILCVSSYVQRISFSWANTASYSIGSSAEESFLTYFLLGKYSLMIKTGLLAWTSIREIFQVPVFSEYSDTSISTWWASRGDWIMVIYCFTITSVS